MMSKPLKMRKLRTFANPPILSFAATERFSLLSDVPLCGSNHICGLWFQQITQCRSNRSRIGTELRYFVRACLEQLPASEHVVRYSAQHAQHEYQAAHHHSAEQRNFMMKVSFHGIGQLIFVSYSPVGGDFVSGSWLIRPAGFRFRIVAFRRTHLVEHGFGFCPNL